jgi:hypothetical protein
MEIAASSAGKLGMRSSYLNATTFRLSEGAAIEPVLPGSPTIAASVVPETPNALSGIVTNRSACPFCDPVSRFAWPGRRVCLGRFFRRNG